MKTLILALFLLSATSVWADSVSLVTIRPAGTDTLDWNQLGQGTISNPFSAISSGGISVVGDTLLAQQAGEPPSVWSGNLWTDFGGPLRITLSTGVAQIGAQLLQGHDGFYTAQICDNLGDCFTEDSDNFLNGAPPIYIGLLDHTGPNITSITFDETFCGACEFSINQLSLAAMVDPPSMADEPGTVILQIFGMAMVGLLVLFGLEIRKERKQ